MADLGHLADPFRMADPVHRPCRGRKRSHDDDFDDLYDNFNGNSSDLGNACSFARAVDVLTALMRRGCSAAAVRRVRCTNP